MEKLRDNEIPVHSDMDMIPDFEELQAGTNPNDEGNESICVGPQYGCAGLSPKGPPVGAWMAMLAALGALLFCRRQRSVS